MILFWCKLSECGSEIGNKGKTWNTFVNQYNQSTVQVKKSKDMKETCGISSDFQNFFS